MREKTFMAGFGGQGIISLGMLWVYSGMKEGLEVTFFPFYGAEKRGGIARASVIVSSEQIASPLVTCADSVVVMNQDSLEICEGALKKDGMMLINSNLVKKLPERTDIQLVKIPCNELAEGIGDIKIANMVMMGALSKATGALMLDKIKNILESFFPESKHKFIPLSIAAVEAGRKSV